MTRMKRLFSAWKDGGKARGAPPPPDLAQPVRTDSGKEKLVDVLTSEGGRHRVGITKAAGLFRTYPESWAPDWETLGTATWLSNGHLGGFADSLERAREQAQEALDALGAGSGPHEG